jgi:hypothetical protein
MALAVQRVAFAEAPGVSITTTVAFTGATTVGNTVVAIVTGFDGAPGVGVMTDSRGNTWTRDYQTTPLAGGTSSNVWVAFWSSVLTSAGTPHTVTYTHTAMLLANLAVAEVSGAAAASGFDASAENGNVNTITWTTGATATLAQADEIAFVGVNVDTGDSATISQDATYTLVGEFESGSGLVSNAAYKIVAATTSINHAWTTTFTAPQVNRWIAAVGTYKAASVVPTGTLAVTEDPDTSAIAGTSTAPAGTFTGTIVVTEAIDVPVIAGTFTAATGNVATLAVTEADDAPVIAGTVTAPVSSFRWPTAVVNHKVVDQLGAPIMFPLFSSWAMAMRLSNSDITWACESLAARGYRGINFAFCGGVDAGAEFELLGMQYTNRAGLPFFTGTPFQSSLGGAFATTDFIASECQRLGLVAMFAFFCSFGDSGITADLEAASTAQMETFGQAVGTRYNGYPNIVWEIMDDGMSSTTNTRRNLDHFAKGLSSTRTAYPNLWFYEPSLGGDAMGTIASEGTDPTGWQWMHLCSQSLYSYDNDHVDDARAAYNAGVAFGGRSLACWDCEPPYAHNTHYDDGIGGELQGVRMRNATVFIQGYSAINYGDEPWWTFDQSGSGSTAYLAVPSNTYTVQASYTWALVNQYINGDATWQPTSWIVTGESTGDTRAAAGYSDTAAIAMFPTSRTIAVNTSVLTGTGNVRVRWFDPSAGTYTTVAASEAQSSSRSVTHPGTNVGGGSDWLLVVDLDPGTTVTGTITAGEATDVAAIGGTFTALPGTITGAVAVTEAVDVVAIVATFTTGPVIGVLVATEANDTPIIVGFLPGAPTEPTGPLVVTVQAWPPPITVTVTQQ